MRWCHCQYVCYCFALPLGGDHRVLKSVGEAITQLPSDWVPKFILFFSFAVADTAAAAAAVSCRCGPQGAQVS